MLFVGVRPLARALLQNWAAYLPDAAVLAAVFLLLLPHWYRKGRQGAVGALFYLYLAGVVWVTILPVLSLLPAPLHYAPMEWQPFRDLRLGYGGAARQLLLNVVMTVPFGLLYPMVRKRRFFATALATLALSFAIELIQPLLPTARTADITDVICNTAGGVIGYLFHRVFRRVLTQEYR